MEEPGELIAMMAIIDIYGTNSKEVNDEEEAKA